MLSSSSSKSFLIKDILSKNHHPILLDDNNGTESILLSKPIDLQYYFNNMYLLYSLLLPSNVSLLSKSKYSIESSPLNLLFQINKQRFNQSSTTNNVFDHNISFESTENVSKRKRRKRRTTFTDYQICGLEKYFIRQKYLTPYDRDQIAHELRLSASQVITWFQNRRAKLRRDCKEFKNDVHTT